MKNITTGFNIFTLKVKQFIIKKRQKCVVQHIVMKCDTYSIYQYIYYLRNFFKYENTICITNIYIYYIRKRKINKNKKLFNFQLILIIYYHKLT